MPQVSLKEKRASAWPLSHFSDTKRRELQDNYRLRRGMGMGLGMGSD